jgi:hypothetical protein
VANTLDAVAPNALDLSPADRILLASRLLRSIDTSDEVDWEKEIASRIDAYDRGQLTSRPAGDAVTDIRRRHLGG